jgi:hypothetical protein
MQRIAPDFNHTIDLPGVGPCPRPVDIDQSVTGFADLVSLRIYSFADGAVINGEAEGDEVFITVMQGSAEIAVSGPESATFELSEESEHRVLYLPPHYHYRLTPKGPVDVAYARARAVGRLGPKAFAPQADGVVLIDDDGYAEVLELRLVALMADSWAEVTTWEGEALPERLVHLRTKTAVLVETENQALDIGDWDTVAFAKGEAATVQARGAGVALIIAARPSGI